MQITFKRRFVPVLAFTAIFCFFQNCGIHSPGVDDMSSTNSSWAGFHQKSGFTSCNSCHDKVRPAGIIASAKGSFSHTSNGTADCVGCHTSVKANIGVTWRGGLFDHKDANGFSVSSCSSCHTPQMPAVPVGTSQFSHATIGTSDCVACHKNTGINWSGGVFNHSPTPAACMSCHAGAVPAAATLVPVGASADLFVHSGTFGGDGDCVYCHSSVPANIGVRWTGGTFNHKDRLGNTISSTCLPCHTQQRPVGLSGSPAFDHANGGTGDCASCHKNPGGLWSGGLFSHSPQPAACVTCHASKLPAPTALLPAGATVDLYMHSATMGGTKDCVSCHTSVPANVGVSWAGGTFNHLGGNGLAVATCLGCHSGQKPVGPVGGPPAFDHASIGTQDCAACHKNAGINWVGGVFNHTPTPVTCSQCHSGQLPAATALLPAGALKDQFVHSGTYVGTGECVGCHTSVVANIGVTFAGATFNHKDSAGVSTTATCIPCHTSQRPLGKIGTPPYDHALGGTGDCATCHKKPGVNWTGGTFSHSPVPTSCSTCHSAELPASNILNPAGATANLFVHSNLFGGTKDCVTCHTSVPANIGTSWAAGYFNHTDSNGTLVTATCVPCHGSERPTGAVGTPPFDHVLSGTGDCASCHASVPANIGVRWSGGRFNHSPTPTSCASCHASSTTYTSIKAVIKNQMSHAAVASLSDCASCHTAAAAASSWANWVAESVANGNSTARATIGVFHANSGTNPASCVGCHAGERPVGAVGTPPFDHANGGTGECMTCHSTVANIGLTWAGAAGVPVDVDLLPPTGTSWPTLRMKHPSTTSQTGMNCASCHSSYAATNSIIGFDHLTSLDSRNSTPLAGTTSGNIFTVTSGPPACIYCHFTGQVVVNAAAISGYKTGNINTDSNHSGWGIPSTSATSVAGEKECTACHYNNGQANTTKPTWNSTTHIFSGGVWK